MLPDECHPTMVEEEFDVLPPPGGEVVDDGDVVVLCQVRPTAGQELEHRRCECLCKVGADKPSATIPTYHDYIISTPDGFASIVYDHLNTTGA